MFSILSTTMHFRGVLVACEVQNHVVSKQFGAENVSLAGGRRVNQNKMAVEQR